MPSAADHQHQDHRQYDRAQSTNGGLLPSCGNYQFNGSKTDGTCPPSRSTEDPRADLGMVESGPCRAGHLVRTTVTSLTGD
jgi:hypothetical protein